MEEGWFSWCVVSFKGKLLMSAQTKTAAEEWRYLHLGHAGANVEYRDVRSFQQVAHG